MEIHTASFRSVRGYTIVAAILDEIAFWPTDDAANPDTGILNALRPAGATVPGFLLLMISSPYARRGELYKAYKDHFGKDGDPVLVWQADSRTMNPLVPRIVIDNAYQADEASASAEYGAQFRQRRGSICLARSRGGMHYSGLLRITPVAERRVFRLRRSKRRESG